MNDNTYSPTIHAHIPGQSYEVEITDTSHLRFSAEIAQKFFPQHYVQIARPAPDELVILPSVPGLGQYLKERNHEGDVSVLATDALSFTHPIGTFTAIPHARGLKVYLPLAHDYALPAQPLGIYELPGGLLLFPDEREADDVRESLLRGQIPEFGTWPDILAGQEAAFAGRLEEAAEIFSRTDSTGARDPISTYNLWVLMPESNSLPVIAKLLEPYGLSGLAELVAFIHGDLPDLSTVGDHTSHSSVAALIRAADIALDDGNPAAQAARLRQAALKADVPLLQGVFHAEACALDPDVKTAEEAISVLRGTDLTETLAEALLGHALATHMHGDVRTAIASAHEALTITQKERNPYLYGRILSELGTALMSTASSGEASSNIRYAQALGYLREALTLLPSGHESWNTCAVNLANALVYAPSSEPRSFLIEAVDLYEKVAKARYAAHDDAGYARVKANQGTALGHLGLFDDAREALSHALTIFESAEDTEGTRITREALEAVNTQEKNHAAAQSTSAGIANSEGNPASSLPRVKSESEETRTKAEANISPTENTPWQPTGSTPAERLDEALKRAEALGPEAAHMAHALESSFTEMMREGLAPLITALKNDDSAAKVLYESIENPETRLAFAVAGLIRLPQPDVRFGPPDMVRSAWHVARGGDPSPFSAVSMAGNSAHASASEGSVLKAVNQGSTHETAGNPHTREASDTSLSEGGASAHE